MTRMASAAGSTSMKSSRPESSGSTRKRGRNEDAMEELEKLGAFRKKVTESLKNAPKGKIVCEMQRGKYPQYYIYDEGKNGERRYLRREEEELARKYAQKEYDLKVLRIIEQKERCIRAAASADKIDRIEGVYTKMCEGKRRLIKPYVLPDDEYAKAWAESFAVNENGIPIVNGYVTERGEMVRSKSEKLIADKLFYKGIPYVYEPSLKLGKKGITIFPDFALLKVRTRETLYLEHFGMMDNEEYCRKTLEKIDLYEENGLFPGEKLLVTFESSTKPINMKLLESILDRNLL